ncbi:MAG: protein kinase [Bacteroidales bacterium]|nr:protein kinase [Bacteroidales bacterium]
MGTRPSGYFKEIGDSYAEIPPLNRLDLVYESPAGHCLIYKGSLGGRIVALKCLKPSLRSDGTYEAVLRHEYEISSPLKHPGICDCLGWFHSEDLGYCLAMEWVEGVDLEEYLSGDEPDVKTALDISLQICDALSYIHRKQVIHNDLKPGNVMLASEGKVVKIIDFSLADSPSMTTGHIPAGTEGYAAPEVVRGCKASVRSDIYSLGKVLSRLLPSRSDVWRKCLDEDPSNRFSSAEEVKAALIRSKKRGVKAILTAVVAIAILTIILFLFPRHGDAAPDSGDVFTDAIMMVREKLAGIKGPDASGFRLEDTLDCLNGRFIVSSEGRKGLMDSTGRIILEPVWEEIEFLSEDVAMLSRGGFLQLCGPDGRVFAESTDKKKLMGAFQSLYEKSLFEDMRRWDEVISCLDSLSLACLSDETKEEVPLRFEDFRRRLESASGSITKNQALRISEIEERYNEHSGR